jgi:hypothetical protein
MPSQAHSPRLHGYHRHWSHTAARFRPRGSLSKPPLPTLSGRSSAHFPSALSFSSTSLLTIFSRIANSPFAAPSKYPATLFSTYFPT